MVIYKITNKINNKIYIGLTKFTPEKRFRYHIRDSKTAKSGIDSAIRKYGQENFTLEVIDSSAKTYDELKELEKFYIESYNSKDKNIGYNQTFGGEGTTGYHHSEESKYKCGNSFRGKNRIKTEDQVSKWRETYIKNGNLIKDEAFCLRQSEGLKRAYKEGRRKPNGKGIGGRGPMTETEKKQNIDNQIGGKRMFNETLKIVTLFYPREFEEAFQEGFIFGNPTEYPYISRKKYKELKLS